MIEHDFPEDFTPIAAELQRLPYLSPSRGFADRVIARIDRLNPRVAVATRPQARRLEVQRGGAVAPVRRRMGPVRVAGTVVAGAGLVAVATFMFIGIDLLTALLASAAAQYAFAITAFGSELGGLVLGGTIMAYLQAGALEALILYFTLVVGLFAGFAAIRTAASIARRKAA